MFSKSLACRLINALYVERKLYSISDLREDIKCLRQEDGIEESIITITRTLKRKMMDTFPKEILLYPNGKYLIVQSSNANPCQYIVAWQKDLKVTSTRKLFFTINYPLRCNEWIFLFEEKIRFHSLDF